MKETKIQWHPGFVAAMNLEFARNRQGLIFEKEYNLNTKPLEIDLLVIKKEASVRIENEIGILFRGHNIMEYKSPEDALDIDAFYKAGCNALPVYSMLCRFRVTCSGLIMWASSTSYTASLTVLLSL